jgi:hypothetical protein
MKAEQKTGMARLQVGYWTLIERIESSSLSGGWAARLAEATKARIAAERHVVEAKRAEEEVCAANKRAEEEERRQRIAKQAVAAKEAQVKTETLAPKLQCTLNDFWLVERIHSSTTRCLSPPLSASSTTVRMSPPLSAKSLHTWTQSILDPWLACPLDKPSSIGVSTLEAKIGTITFSFVAICGSSYSNAFAIALALLFKHTLTTAISSYGDGRTTGGTFPWLST